MARAMGARATLLGLFESAYGTAPTSSSWNSFPFARCLLSAEQPLQADKLLGQGRDAVAPIMDVITVDGEVEVPVDVNNIGHWLKLVFGAPTTTGTTPKTHTFSSGGWGLPSMTLEQGFPDIDQYFQYTGVKANTCAVSWSRQGAARMVLGLIGQKETIDQTTFDSSPLSATLTKFNQFQGSIASTEGGADLADVESASFVYSNNLDRVEVIRSDGLIGALDDGEATLTGSFTMRFANEAILAKATAGTAIDLTLAHTIDSSNKLEWIMPALYLPKPRITTPGPGGIRATFDFLGAKSGSNPMLKAVLKNAISSY